jgi:peptide/nickel transport system substrate-binding protein
MRVWMRSGVIGLAAAVALTACAAPPRTGGISDGGQPEPARPAVLKRITAVIRDNPPSMVTLRTRPSAHRGLDGIEELTHAGFSYLKADGTRVSQLAEAVPNLENGLWRIFPDGRMETTWKIKASARWHDGAPLTAEDLLFASTVERDKELEITFASYEQVENIAVVDPRTITVTWKRPYIEADGMFSYRGGGLPLPRHVLERPYGTDKANFLGLAYWGTEFLGAGAYRVHDWVTDSHVVLRAYDDYVLGRPKIDEIEVKFIQDNNTLLANVLAGIDLTLGKTISLDMAMQARDKWREGQVVNVRQNWTPLNPQWINPDPPIIGNYQFRKALYLALDRQELADFVMSGQGAVAHSYVSPEMPLYHLVEPAIVKYGYDPRQSTQLLEGLGYTKRPDGFLYDADGRKLVVDIHIPLQNDVHSKTAAPVANAWQQLGVGVDQTPIPIQRQQDREWRAQFPSFNIVERVNSTAIADIWRFHSSQVPLAENRWLAGGFASRYRSPVVDAALERYLATIPPPERMDALATLVRHQTENLTELPLFYGADPTLISNRLVNVTGRGPDYTQAWNAHEWDLRN